ncbi:hypothetical protein HK102_005467 [Quaeritorhiza haematococci]|nr:hypothetical protein HK102_005467 [Quaeritorhiza haematococci]
MFDQAGQEDDSWTSETALQLFASYSRHETLEIISPSSGNRLRALPGEILELIHTPQLSYLDLIMELTCKTVLPETYEFRYTPSSAHSPHDPRFNIVPQPPPGSARFQAFNRPQQSTVLGGPGRVERGETYAGDTRGNTVQIHLGGANSGAVIFDCGLEFRAVRMAQHLARWIQRSCEGAGFEAVSSFYGEESGQQDVRNVGGELSRVGSGGTSGKSGPNTTKVSATNTSRTSKDKIFIDDLIFQSLSRLKIYRPDHAISLYATIAGLPRHLFGNDDDENDVFIRLLVVLSASAFHWFNKAEEWVTKSKPVSRGGLSDQSSNTLSPALTNFDLKLNTLLKMVAREWTLAVVVTRWDLQPRYNKNQS